MSRIPLCKTFFDGSEEKLMLEALRSGWLAHGPFNKQLEERFCRLLGVRHAISNNSCTSALFLALQLSGVRGEVLLPSFTFVASANAVVTAGATPCFVDIDPATCNLDPDAVAAKINDRTEAIMVVHFAGQPAAMDRLAELSQRHGLLLIEDSAETIGATFGQKQAGSFGIGCFSFFPTKNITTGEGGMLTTDDDELAARCRASIGHGIVKTTYQRESEARPWFRDAHFPGYNFRMSNVLAAIGCAQFDKLEQITSLRQQNACALAQALEPAVLDGHLQLPGLQDGATHTYQMFTVQLSDATARDDLVRALNAQDIGASVHFDPPVHLQTFYRDYLEGRPVHLASDLGHTEATARRIVTLPMFPQLQPEQIERMGRAVCDFFGSRSQT